MTFLFSDQYGIASEMMFYVPGHPKTYNIPLGRRMNQFDVRAGTEEVLGVTGSEDSRHSNRMGIR